MAPRLDSNETGGLTPDQFLDHYRRIRQARPPMESAVGAYRQTIQRAKNAGVDTFALSLLERLSKLGEEQAQLHMRNLFRMADWSGTNVGQKQGDLFGAAADQAPSEEAAGLFSEQLAEENGHKAGRARERADTNPHEAGAAAHAAWARGWTRGQGEEVMATFGAKAPKPPKQATRRGRNPAAETRETPPDADAGPANDDEINTQGPRGRRRGARPAAPLTPKARRAAIKASDRLTGAPTSSTPPVF